MKEKKYLLLLRKQLQQKRVVCGFNEDSLGRAVVTTGIPKEYKAGAVTYVDQKTMCYDDYIRSNFQEKVRRR